MKQFADHLIGSVRGRIEGEVGEILSLITDGRYEYVTIDDDFSIRVHEAGDDYPASRFSGGEQDDIAVALRIALSRHIAATHRIRDATVLIFDEIFGSQDEERRRNLVRALRKQEPYFPQILLISHIEGVQEECRTVIRVEEQPDLTSLAVEVEQ
jgi:exonuclease SbcC